MMRIRTKHFTGRIAFCLLWIVTTFPAGGQDAAGGTPAIFPVVEKNQLTARFHLPDIPDDKMRETLASGMSTRLIFEIRLVSQNSDRETSRLRRLQMRFDVWEKKYELSFGTLKRTFENRKSFENYLQDSLICEFGVITDRQTSWQILAFYGPERLASGQKDRVSSWLNNEGRTEESQPGAEQESGFSISLSGLITMFIKDEEQSGKKVIRSDTFTLESLRE